MTSSHRYMMRQALTGELRYLSESTVEFLEKMRSYCKENHYDILEFFKDDFEEKFGCVPEYAFFYVIREKFWKQTDFSMDQVRHVVEFFKVPDGKIWYSMLDSMMKSDETVLNQIRKTAYDIIPISGASSFGSFTPFGGAMPVQNSVSYGSFSQPIGLFGALPPQQQQSSSLFVSTPTSNSTLTGLFGTGNPTKNVTTGGSFSTPASVSVSAPGFFSGGSLSGSQPANQNGSFFGGSFGNSSGGSAFSSFGSQAPNSGGTNIFGNPLSASSVPTYGLAFGATAPTAATNIAAPITTGKPPPFQAFSFGSATTTSGNSTFANPSTSGEPNINGGGIFFGSSLTPTSVNKTETAGPTLPGFAHGSSQQSTSTVTKILGSNQNQPSTQQRVTASWSSGGGFGIGGFGGVAVAASNGTPGLGASMLGSGDVTTSTAVQDTTKAGGLQTDSEGLPKKEQQKQSITYVEI